jgi:acyl-homoserine lactone acylase PvdQ
MLIALALGALVILAGALVAQRTLPKTTGTHRIPQLHRPVTVVRDRLGVPYLYASDNHDLYIAQGYVTAQDRLWQILLRRQAARGQLTDWLGINAQSADQALGRENLMAQASAYLPTLKVDTLNTLQAYAIGVNACIQTCPAPLELTLLKIQGRPQQIEPWTATDSMALTLMMLWVQEQQPGAELRQELLARVGITRTQELWPQDALLPPFALSTDPAVRQAMQWGGLGLLRDEQAASKPLLPAPWYMASLHSEGTTLAGGTWPGLPGVMVKQAFPPNLSPQQEESVLIEHLVKHLLALPPEGWLQTRVHGMLRQWDFDLSGETRLGNASAAVYQTWTWYLARDVFQDELGSELFSRYWATRLAPEMLARLVERPADPWWGDATTPQLETRDDLLRRAYVEALDYLGRHYGDLHTIWEWNTMHAAQFDHALGDTWLLAKWLDRTANLGDNAPFDPTRPGSSYNTFRPVLIPSLQINQNRFSLAGGQSGNPFSPHYADLLALWARSELVSLQDVTRPEETKDVEGVLVLTP